MGSFMLTRQASILVRAAARAIVAFAFMILPGLAWCAEPPVRIPKPGEGYQITRTDSSRAAPSGYEGRTDTATVTAVGNTPATTGKRIVARFTLSNQVKTCPEADGRAEGEGVLSMIIDSTDAKPSGTNTLHIEVRAIAKYKGQVGDDAWIVNPVKGEIDYTYTLSGTMRDPSGAIATPAGSNVAQHITIPFGVSRSMEMPSIGTVEGGDPTQGRYAEAYGTGVAVAYWAGVYYSVAQLKWRQDNTCVTLAFTPPSYSVRLVPGDKTTVDAEVKTKGGESVKANFLGARARSNGGSVTPAGGASDARMPMKFEFTAPTQRVPSAGFTVGATSRAGIASGDWYAGLGTDWSGRISLTITNAGDAGENELQSWSNSSVTRISVDLRDGKGTATGYSEVHYMQRQRQKALRGGAITLINNGSQSVDGSHEDSSPATVEVLYPAAGRYSIRVEYAFMKDGKSRAQTCDRTNCRDSDQQLVIGAPLPWMEGTTDDPNHVRGSKSEVKTGTGRAGTGTQTTTVTWDLARQGTAR
jgi:hypothetical protein